MLWLFLLPTSTARPIHLCTDRGGLLGQQDDSGVITGVIDGWIRAEGTATTLRLFGQHGSWSRPQEELLWTGPLAALTPSAPPSLDGLPGSERDLAERLHHIGLLASCPRSGTEAFFVGAWPDPLPLHSGRVTWASATQSLLRTDAGPVWMMSMAMSAGHAAGLAAELASAWPDLHTAVAWRDDLALVQVSRDPTLLIDGVTPAASELRLLPLVSVPSTVLDAPALPGADGLPVHDAGRELAAHLNTRRAEAGLSTLSWDDELARSALDHCAYIDWQNATDQTFYSHDQADGGPMFTGRTPGDRHGGWEVIHRDRDAAPHAGVETWLATPFHRIGPMHPMAQTVGACRSPGGAMVMVTKNAAAKQDAVTLYPPIGAVGVPLSFSGLENPDPLPISEYPDKTLPVGFTVTAWLSGLSAPPKLLSTRMLADGVQVDHYPVFRPGQDYRRGDVEIHLIAAAPYPPEAEIQWQIKLRSNRQRVAIRGHFTTTDRPGSVAVTLPDHATEILAGLNAARAAVGLPPLSTTHRSQGVASLYAHTHEWPAALETAAWATCMHPEADDPGAGFTEQALRLEFDQLGASLDHRGYRCIILMSDPLTPR